MKYGSRVKPLIISALLAAEIIIPVSLSACSKTDTTDSVTSAEVTSAEETTADDRLYPKLPEVTYDGYIFNFVQWEQVSYGNMVDDIFSDGSGRYAA